ncbi:hypothetical protein TraAM80_02518 [Trypanosoma rangeli]|uniref:Uncharacterized protein n=1 Tax=Trypanosoma rangeli TaxID=5698 RepID=A0A422NUE8_TRYRA|nr:uncharacterized protein TraAM80_02518 [Trypanosoma rangeli]RNF09086.1 hypothetical protein TraAM80_02518 [Trypanosoma rangeli]|eukprot:RNF09086.1 hypothetical protein TraAM80_02518 [Trypanosoma rangeli]
MVPWCTTQTIGPSTAKLIYMAPYDGTEKYGPVEQPFGPTCAGVVGLGIFVVCVVMAVMRLLFDVMWGAAINAAAGSCAYFLCISQFLFYIFSSNDEHYFGHFI